MSARAPLTDGVVSLRPARDADRRAITFLVEHEGEPVGRVEIRDQGDLLGHLSWALEAPYRGRGLATRALRLLVRYAFDELGMHRLEAYVEPDNHASIRVAGRAGLRREGLLRRRSTVGDRETTGEDRPDAVVLARLADDPEPHEPEGFRALLNAGLPRKRVIAQMAVRDTRGRLLLCALSYKPDWDLPGGVVEVGESPRLAAAREVEEELALTLSAGGLLAVDWLPAWSGWDDACTLVFDGGVHSPDLTEAIVPEPREIREARFCDVGQIRERCAPQTARRALAVLEAQPGSPRYLESGRDSF